MGGRAARGLAAVVAGLVALGWVATATGATPTRTPIATASATPTRTPTATASATPTRMPTVAASATPTQTWTVATDAAPDRSPTVAARRVPCQLFTGGSRASLPAQLTGDDVTAAGTLGDLSLFSRCAGGWHLDAATTRFVSGQRSLPVDALRVTGVAVRVIYGRAPTNGVGYPLALVAEGPASRIFSVPAGSGVGAFVLTPRVTLTVPAQTYAGAYSATITLTLSAGP